MGSLIVFFLVNPGKKKKFLGTPKYLKGDTT